MSHFSHYYVHSCFFCHNYSYFLIFLTSQSVCLLNSMSNLMLSFMSDFSQKLQMLNLITLNYCALTSTADLVCTQIYISMSDYLLACTLISFIMLILFLLN